MFRSVSRDAEATVTVCINGEIHKVAAGSSVWSAMALAGATETRKAPLTGKPRSAYCAMGVCFECLVEIDGMPNRQACLTQVTEGMSIWQQSITEETVAESDSVQEGGHE
ncbi:MAG: (2Fe-2S)-binding protein [Amphritea sp.]|nr:(2Fe-2S)-binding protein [Amphritea sp.]